VQIDDMFQKTPSSSAVSLGTKQKVDHVAVTVDRAVQVLPLASDVNISLVHRPARTQRAFALT
jgi:putative NIF3 family GTP cyclohydrolase 1 type 2